MTRKATPRQFKGITGMPSSHPPVLTHQRPRQGVSGPIVNTVDLPMPPSVNRLWRATAGNRLIRSAAYLNWIEFADQHCLVNRTLSGARKIAGPFKAQIALDGTIVARADLDNRAKAVLDWCQSRELIANDRNLEELAMWWTTTEFAPVGCRVILTAL